MSVPQPTRVPLVMRALAALGEDMKTDDVVDQVLVGPTPKVDLLLNRGTLVIFAGVPGVEVRYDLVQQQQDVYLETLDVTCNAISWSGGADAMPHVDVCEGILSGLKDRIGADPHLGGICETAFLGARGRWTPVSDSDGTSVAVAFTVRVQSYV